MSDFDCVTVEELGEQVDQLREENERLRNEHRIMGETLTAAQEIATRETMRRREWEERHRAASTLIAYLTNEVADAQCAMDLVVPRSDGAWPLGVVERVRWLVARLKAVVTP